MTNSKFINNSRLISSDKISLDTMNILNNQFYDDSQLIYIKYVSSSDNVLSNI